MHRGAAALAVFPQPDLASVLLQDLAKVFCWRIDSDWPRFKPSKDHHCIAFGLETDSLRFSSQLGLANRLANVNAQFKVPSRLAILPFETAEGELWVQWVPSLSGDCCEWGLEGTFDLVLGAALLTHAGPRANIIANLARLTSADGTLISLEPDTNSISAQVGLWRTCCSRYSRWRSSGFSTGGRLGELRQARCEPGGPVAPHSRRGPAQRGGERISHYFSCFRVKTRLSGGGEGAREGVDQGLV